MSNFPSSGEAPLPISHDPGALSVKREAISHLHAALNILDQAGGAEEAAAYIQTAIDVLDAADEGQAASA